MYLDFSNTFGAVVDCIHQQDKNTTKLKVLEQQLKKHTQGALNIVHYQTGIIYQQFLKSLYYSIFFFMS